MRRHFLIYIATNPIFVRFLTGFRGSNLARSWIFAYLWFVSSNRLKTAPHSSLFRFHEIFDGKYHLGTFHVRFHEIFAGNFIWTPSTFSRNNSIISGTNGVVFSTFFLSGSFRGVHFHVIFMGLWRIGLIIFSLKPSSSRRSRRSCLYFHGKFLQHLPQSFSRNYLFNLKWRLPLLLSPSTATLVFASFFL